MAHYELTPLAQDDLVGLHQYGVRQWGLTQADTYLSELFDHFEKIATDPHRYPAVTDIHPNARRSVFAPHAVYFEIIDEAILVLGIIRSQDTGHLSS